MHNTMKGAYLDFLLVKEYFKTIIYLFIISIVFSVSIRSISAGMVTAMTILAMRVVSLPFESEERTEINKFYDIIPMLRSQRVYGRYFFTILIGILGAVFSVIIQSIVFLSIGINITIIESMVGLGISLCIYLFSITLQIPFFYRYGAIKGRLAITFPLIGYGLFYYLSGRLANFGIELSMAIPQIFDNKVVIGFILVIFVFVSLAVSIKIATKICNSQKYKEIPR